MFFFFVRAHLCFIFLLVSAQPAVPMDEFLAFMKDFMTKQAAAKDAKVIAKSEEKSSKSGVREEEKAFRKKRTEFFDSFIAERKAITAARAKEVEEAKEDRKEKHDEVKTTLNTLATKEDLKSLVTTEQNLSNLLKSPDFMQDIADKIAAKFTGGGKRKNKDPAKLEYPKLIPVAELEKKDFILKEFVKMMMAFDSETGMVPMCPVKLISENEAVFCWRVRACDFHVQAVKGQPQKTGQQVHSTAQG